MSRKLFFGGERRADIKTIRIRGIRSNYPDPNPKIRPIQYPDNWDSCTSLAMYSKKAMWSITIRK